MKTGTFLAASLLLFVLACTKPQAGYYNRPIRTSAEVEAVTPDTNYIGNAPRASRRRLVFKTPDEQRVVLNPNEVWGFETRTGQRYRAYNKQYYELEELGPITIYSQTYSYTVGNVMQTHTNFFFSRTPDSPIYPLRKRFLREQFSDNPTFVGLINARRLRVYNRKTNRFYLNEWYQEVQNR